MPAKKSGRQSLGAQAFLPGRRGKKLLMRRRSQVIIAIVTGLSLIGIWSMLAYSGAVDPLFGQKRKKGGTVSTASFNSNSPSKEYVYAGGRLVATEEPTSSVGCTAPSAPGTLTATAASTTSVNLSWSASSGTVDHYTVERRNGSGSYSVVATVPPQSPTVSITDMNGVIADTAYVYRVQAFSDQSGSCGSQYSSIDLATTVDFSQDPPVAQTNTIYAVHLTRLRTAVNAVRVTALLQPFNWTDSSTNTQPTETPAFGGRIRKDQLQKLRDKLDEARSALGLPAQTYSNQPLSVGVIVYANHILQLRQGVQ